METELEAAKLACRNEDYSMASFLLKSHLQRHQDDGRAWEMLGIASYNMTDYQDSVAALERASLFVPLQIAASIRLALGYGKLGRRQLSRDLLESLVDDCAITADLLLEAASGLDAVKAPDLAAYACRKANASDPLMARPYFDLGYYSGKCGCPAKVVVSLLRKAVSLEPRNVTYRVGLATVLIQLQRWEEAYQSVKNFSYIQIKSIGCVCCLERIVSLYKMRNDGSRVTWCHIRILDLTPANGSNV